MYITNQSIDVGLVGLLWLLAKNLLSSSDHIRVQRVQARRVGEKDGEKQPRVPLAHHLFCLAETHVDHGHFGSDARGIQHIEKRVSHPREPRRNGQRVSQVGRIVRVSHHFRDGPRQTQGDVYPMVISRRLGQHSDDSKHNQQARKHSRHGGENRRLDDAKDRVVDLHHGTRSDQGKNGGRLFKKQRSAEERAQKECVEKHNRPERRGDGIVGDKPSLGVGRLRHGVKVGVKFGVARCGSETPLNGMGRRNENRIVRGIMENRGRNMRIERGSNMRINNEEEI
ncbi:hypothetical protein CLUG_00449 [Clavispora lusitaniae ATCC 42720]|uniref:Uncharacterized protein n=1 Tax=Clavispora lusitaniae (strain ATCC 42720) TaxID=306902 RepID=C4XWX6_CLAL4|nr:uncharacterized protein CLUG_00449 [Clavispora lusitaniae ATCC 42720]EEQ36327.1 hypothetical protein CLUG_00449 [Clavispora lusitaniae ATCC 42720]